MPIGYTTHGPAAVFAGRASYTCSHPRQHTTRHKLAGCYLAACPSAEGIMLK